MIETNPRVKIGLIHTTIMAVKPSIDAFAAMFPRADLMHFLDEGLLVAFGRGGVGPEALNRTLALCKAAQDAGSVALQCTCSTLSVAFDYVTPFLNIPVSEVDAACADETVSKYSSIALVTTGASVHKSMVKSWEKAMMRIGKRPQLVTIVANAGGAKRGTPAFFEAIAKDVSGAADKAEAVVVGQVSMTGCMDYIREDVRDRVFTGLSYAIPSLEKIVGGDRP